MSSRPWSFLFLTLLAAAALGINLSQRRVTAELRAEAGRLRDASAERDRLRATHQSLTAEQVTAAELAALRADHAALGRLRNEVDATRRRADALARGPGAKSPPVPAGAKPTLLDRALAANEWTNAGRANPAAALETALWAAAGGDVDQLATTLDLEPEARTRAEAILAGLPSAARGQYGTADRLVALLTARAVPLGSAQILNEVPDASGSTLLVRLRDPAGQGRTLSLSLSTDGDNWRLVVPAQAVERYGAALTAPAAGAP